jgi:hypothetical protein
MSGRDSFLGRLQRSALLVTLFAALPFTSPAASAPSSEPLYLFGWVDDVKAEVLITWKPQGDEQAQIDALGRRYDGRDPLLPPSENGVPQRARALGPQRLCTARGLFLADHLGFRVGNPGSGDGARLRIVFAMPPALKDAERHEVLALSPRLRGKEGLREATVRPPARQLGASLLPALRAKLDGDSQSRIGEEAIRIAPGQFPEPHSFLVLLRESNRAHEPQRLSGLTLASAKGQLSGVLFPPQTRPDVYSVDFLVDIDGDSFDEVILHKSDRDAQHFFLLRWVKAQPQLVPLYGSGI